MNKNVKDLINKNKSSFYFDEDETNLLVQSLNLIETLDSNTSLSILSSLNHKSLCNFMSSSIN